MTPLSKDATKEVVHKVSFLVKRAWTKKKKRRKKEGLWKLRFNEKDGYVMVIMQSTSALMLYLLDLVTIKYIHSLPKS